jgi:hypothetical protein
VGVIEEFREDFAQHNCVLVVGTGVSMATTRDPKSTWAGLLESGVRYAVAKGSMDAETAELCAGYMAAGSSTEDYLEVATAISDALKPAGLGDWLNRDIGNLEIRDATLAQALLDLRRPIITTNYDDLLERVGHRTSVTWLTPPAFQQVIANASDAIAHLHGFYLDPPSVVLTKASYDLLLADQYMRALSQSMALVTTVVYVGFGAGISDPNFSSIRSWLKQTAPDQTLRHYRLCTSGEREELLEEHVDEQIYLVPYGDSHEDLAPFISSLTPRSAATRHFDATAVLETFEEEVRSKSIIRAHVPRLQYAKIKDLLLPPILLPVSAEQYAARSRESGPKLQRCDPWEELKHEHTLICGDDDSGISSALLWLAAQRQLQAPDLIPVQIDFLNLKTSTRPLDREIRRQLRLMGYPINNADDLPHLGILIDNVHVGDLRVLKRMASELAEYDLAFVTLGCRSGLEVEVQAVLADVGMRPLVRYMGKLNRDDVRSLASLADPERAVELADIAVDTVRTQHLPNTPFTFSLIVSALLQGETMLAASSRTVLLDKYVNLLMGWAQADDARAGLDSGGRSYIVERVAEVLVEQRRGSLSQAEMLEHLASIIDDLDWSMDPGKTLQDLQTRSLLVIRGGQVFFNQSSYLHLFAAKRAQHSQELLKVLKSDTLFYNPILAHYAALQRDDKVLLHEVVHRLHDFLAPVESADGIFTNKTPEPSVPDLESVGADIGDDVERIQSESTSDEDVTPLDEESDADIEPFPLEPLDDAPMIIKLATALSLASQVLRDSELVIDHALKTSSLSTVLTSWAQLARLVEIDSDFLEFVKESADEVSKILNVPARHRAEFARHLIETSAISVVHGGISATLSSKKLERALARCRQQEHFGDDPGQALMAALLAYDAEVEDWIGYLEWVVATHADIRAIDLTMPQLAQTAIVHRNLKVPETDKLIDLQIKLRLGELDDIPAARLASVKANIRDRILKAKMSDKVETATKPDEIDI